MSKKRILCFLVAMVMCCAVFSACTPETPVNTQPATNETTQATTVENEPVTTESSPSELKLAENYLPVKAFDFDGNEVGLDKVYGSGFREHGGYLSFKEDGTFTTFIGVFGNIDKESGTYKIISDTEIEMTFNNDTAEIAVVTQVDSDGNVTELRMPHRSHEVVFSQQ